MDGFKALVLLNQRFDVKNSARLLSSFLEVVNPTSLKGSRDIVSGIQEWERKVASMKSRYGEEVKGHSKLAILVSMLPKDHQEEIIKMGSTEKKLEYEMCRHYIVSLANQRIVARIPKPADIGNINQQEEEAEREDNTQSQIGEYYNFDVGAITNPTNPNI
eukprot:6543240-Karenia_brevis.AAC.1